MKNVLLVKMSSLGDVIHNFPAVSDIRRVRSDLRVHWVVEEQYVPLVALHPGVSRILPIALRRWRRSAWAAATWREWRAFRKTVRECDYEAIVDSQGLLKSAWVCTLARGRRIGFGPRTAREPFAARFYDERLEFAPEVHKIQRYRTLAAHALGYAIDASFEYGIAPPSGAATFVSTPYCIVFHSTAREAKLWSERGWIEVCTSLGARGLATVLPWGSAAEHERSRRLASAIPGALVPPRLSIPDLAGAIAGAKLVLGVDTGLMHLAAALAVPVVGVFTDSSPIDASPVGAGAHAYCGDVRAPPRIADVLDAVRKVLPAWADSP
jgi:heptosyltransferase-1